LNSPSFWVIRKSLSIIHGATIGVINPDNEMITGAF